MQLNNYTVPLDVKFGWVDQPNQRGTIDIIWSCVLVIIASIWTVVHINVPADNESYWHILIRKIRWAVYVLLAPEMLVVVAGLQWESARTSVTLMQKSDCHQWTMVHGFFADSGGFLLCPPDMTPFPVNSRAVFYLVQRKYIKLPSISRAEIEDRSKADIFVKIVVVVQAVYLVGQCVARHIQNLAISCLELATIAFVVCTAASYFFWMEKPLNAEKAVRIEMSTSMAQVICEAGPVAAHPYKDTPMDFVEQPGWRTWRRRSRFTHWGLKRRPIERIPNDYVAEPGSIAVPMVLWFVMSTYGAIHILAWNFSFPTSVDLWIWRVASIVSFTVLSVWGFVEILTVLPWFNYDMTVLGIWENKSTKHTLWRRWALDGPGTVSAMSYFVARLFLVGEMFASMRSMESTTYTNIDWTQFIPHA